MADGRQIATLAVFPHCSLSCVFHPLRHPPSAIQFMNPADLRREYAMASLDVADVEKDPQSQFRRWFVEAQQAAIREPNAMTLATATPDGRPSARVVLLKTVDARGFGFFTDFRSRKAAELDRNPQAALAFAWLEIERQVRIEGKVSRMASGEAANYFRTRPLGSRYGAWASIQSSVIPGRAWLESAVRDVEARHPDGDVPLPPHWGGFILAPVLYEFWQGRESRLHDRVQYRLEGGSWVIERLAP
jgi:pyridoxamine 5'-phosphate oxidase